MDNTYIVRFDEFCRDCAHYKEDETESPCHECLDTPGRTESRRPEYWREKR